MKRVNEFGERLARLRTERGLSLSKLSAKSGVSKGHLHDLERGKAKNPSVVTLMLIAGALGASAEEFAVLAMIDASATFRLSAGLKTGMEG